MIITANIRTLHIDDFDEVWYIVRQLKAPNGRARHVPELSPSQELFAESRRLISELRFTAEVFQTMYVPRMLVEMHSEDARAKLNELFARDRAGERIAIACYCPVETRCHRSIIAGLLQGAGANVETEWGRDYSHYYKQYMEITKGESK